MCPELDDLHQIIERAGSWVELRTLCVVDDGAWPIEAVLLGNADPDSAAIAFIGGVHGLERIGAHVVMAYLRSLISRLRWDHSLHQQLEQVRLVFVPILNPGGFARGTRANPNGVDLMRNSPVEAADPVPWLIGGQRWSRNLPWYRGPLDCGMEVESQTLCDLIQTELLGHRFSMAVDCHSGFGSQDRIWFPYAHTSQPIRHLPEMHALMEILDQTYSHHRYIFEPQSRQYRTHGDLWDYLYLESIKHGSPQGERAFLPLTLEMGSWLWIKKNWRQVFSRHGIFNPQAGYRHQRVLRRHIFWLEFMTRAAGSHLLWCPLGEAREQHRQQAMQRWYDSDGAR